MIRANFDILLPVCRVIRVVVPVPLSVNYHLAICIWVVAGVMVAQYLQNVTRRLALGSELLYQYGQTVPGNEIAIYTMVGRYSGRSKSGFVRVVEKLENH